MNRSPSADTRILSVSIVAGPSADGLVQQIGIINDKQGLILRAGSLSPEGQRALEQISAIAEQGEVAHLIIECDSHMPAVAYASLLLSPPLTQTARLTKTVLAIRPSDLVDSLIRVAKVELGSPCFLAEQLEFVNNIVLDGGNEDPDSKRARDISTALNPRALVSDLSPETVKGLLDSAETTLFDFAAAVDGAGWRQLIDGEILPHGEESGIASFAYRARRPFHPGRFWTLLQDGLPGLFRAKGFFWLAPRMDLVGGLNLAGAELHCAGAGQWWAARDDHARQHHMPERTRKEWKEPFGDRRQAIAFIGLDIDREACKTQLDACLLTDSEMAAGPESWATLTDPFPSWAAHSHTHECEHDRESGDHECCHH
jgi:G3E family GTPase